MLEKNWSNSLTKEEIKTIRTFGLSETEIARQIEGLEEKFFSVSSGLIVCFPEIKIRLYARGEEVTEQLNRAADWINKRLGDKVFSDKGQDLQAVIGELLRNKQATLAIAESCTGGLVAHWITSVPGSSEYFLFSGVTYDNKVKIKLLGVAPETLSQYGAVSEQTALEMARGVRNWAGADFGVSTTGIAGPGGGTKDKPVGTICLGLAGPKIELSRMVIYQLKDRNQNKKIFAMTALDLLRKALL